jgi:hypothetical protein
MQFDAAWPRSEKYRFADQCGVIVADRGPSQWPFRPELIQESGQALTRDRRIDQVADTLLGKVIYDVQAAGSTATGQFVAHEVVVPVFTGAASPIPTEPAA